MIKVTVKKAALKRGIKNAYRLAQKLQGTNAEPEIKYQLLAGDLWHGRREPRLETIDKTAEALGDCDLSELLVRVPNKRPRQNGTG